MRYRLMAGLAALGFGVSLVIHVCGWLQIPLPVGPAMALVHLGLFAVWMPLGFAADRTKPPEAPDNISHLFAELPRWVRAATVVLVGYVALNFIYFAYCTLDYPKYGVPLWVQMRGFSGHLLLFYWLALLAALGLARLPNAPAAVDRDAEGVPKGE